MNSYSSNMSQTSSYGLDINGNACPPCPPEQSQGGNNGYEDYTGMGPTRLEETDLYAKSINISDAKPAEEDPSAPPNYRQKVTRRVEVPFTRKVKVPTRTTKIVPTTVEMRVPVKKLVTVPSFKVVDEEYTVFEEREAVREKEIWVKQIVPEKYMQKVPVKMTRQVKKPHQEIREVEEMVSVQVPSTQAVEVDGYRIDDVEDTKVVEVEEFQEFEYKAHPTGQSELSRTREMGRLPNSRIARNIGEDTFHEQHPDIRGLDLDSNPGYANERPFSASQGYQQGGAPGQQQGGGMRDPFEPDFSQDNFTHTDFIRAAGKNLSMGSVDTEMVRKSKAGLGLSVRNTHTRHSDGTGVLITHVDNGGKAALAGLVDSDIITSINGMPTQTVEEFAAALQASDGPLNVRCNRDGRKNVFAVIQR